MASSPNTQELRDLANRYLWMHNRDWVGMSEADEPIIVVEGDGIRVRDSEGRSWIDVNGGYNSVNLGYGRAEIAEAAYEQLLRSNYMPVKTTTPPAIMLAEKLAELAPGSLSRSFLVSGGAEANEVALKMLRAYHRRRGETGRYKVISRKHSYHGSTGGVDWLGGGPESHRDDYEPAYPGMVYAPQPNPYRCEHGGESPSECAVRCAKAVEDLVRFHSPETVVAVIGEPVARGAVVPGDEYWPMVREICDRYGVPLIADEVVTGFGRTGRMFAVEHWGIVPDVMTVANGLVGSYLPLGAAIATKEVADRFAGKDRVFRHTFTFAGHPVAAAAALKSIELIESERLADNAADVGGYFEDALDALMDRHPIVGDVRGLGLMLAVELVSDRKTKAGFSSEQDVPGRLNEKLRRRGLLYHASSEVLNIGPPLTITRAEVDEIVDAFDGALGELESEMGM
jgi:putrescine aminotransferase